MRYTVLALSAVANAALPVKRRSCRQWADRSSEVQLRQLLGSVQWGGMLRQDGKGRLDSGSASRLAPLVLAPYFCRACKVAADASHHPLARGRLFGSQLARG